MKKNQKVTAVLFLVIVACLLILGGYGINYFAQIPIQAEMVFGPPSVHLTTFQKYSIAYRLVENQETLLLPAPTAPEEFLFTIEFGETTNSILSRLESVGAISSVSLLRDYIIYSGIDTQLQAGDFYISPTMSQVEIISVLLDPTPLYIPVSILAGWRLEEIANSIASSGFAITPDQFITAANQRYNSLPIMPEIPVGVSVEGFFPPGVYEVERTSKAEQLVPYLLDQFDQNLTKEIRQGFDQQNLTIHQGVTLASIVEREAVIDDEMPIIASVFLNRLKISMKLETDPTVQYALGYNSAQATWWKTSLTYDDLEVDSPYNTYMYPGLPPTPIANPSMAALQAVAFPAQTPYFFFRAACDDSGRHNFSQTFEEHLNFACQ